MVYDLTVNNHTLWVRRNNTPVWSGNCPYDDAQDTFILGNVLNDRLTDLWTGEKKKAFANQVRNRTKDNHPAPCVNALCCQMWDSLPESKP